MVRRSGRAPPPGASRRCTAVATPGRPGNVSTAGSPAKQAWITVLRQAMCADEESRVGLYFGTTQGEIWASLDEGDTWRCLANRLPEIYSVTHGA